jgi:hypothetical protein
MQALLPLLERHDETVDLRTALAGSTAGFKFPANLLPIYSAISRRIIEVVSKSPDADVSANLQL